MTFSERLIESAKKLPRVFVSAISRLYLDDGFARAAALAYTTLLALVPLVALVISLLPGFGVGREQALRVILDFLQKVLPAQENELLMEMQAQVFSFIERLSGSVADLNTVSLAVLVATTVALFLTIQTALNRVWKVSSELGFFTRMMNFAAVITLGLMLISLSIYATTKLLILPEDSPLKGSIFFSWVQWLLPTILTWIALTMLYYKGPSTFVRLRDAALGAGVAAVLFEILKTGFAYYVSLSTTYSTLYGVIASIPLFLFWLYLLWVLVLFGAEVTYQSGSYRVLISVHSYATELGDAGIFLGIRLLFSIGQRFIQGEIPPSEGELAEETGADPVIIRQCLDLLTEAEVLGPPEPETRKRTLLLSPKKITMARILDTFGRKKLHIPLQEEKDDSTFLSDFRKSLERLDPKVALREYTLYEFLEDESR